jgi:hypothetical protein
MICGAVDERYFRRRMLPQYRRTSARAIESRESYSPKGCECAILHDTIFATRARFAPG